jgi:AbrB family looped-hinge helix DNA binding protein
MNAKVTLDKAGRLVLPKSIREALRIGPGDTLDVESDDDRLVISPVRLRPGLQREQGIWVYRSGSPVETSIPELIDRQRGQRAGDLQRDGQ